MCKWQFTLSSEKNLQGEMKMNKFENECPKYRNFPSIYLAQKERIEYLRLENETLRDENETLNANIDSLIKEIRELKAEMNRKIYYFNLFMSVIYK